MKHFRFVFIPVVALAALVAIWRPAPMSATRMPRPALEPVTTDASVECPAPTRLTVEGGELEVAKDGWRFTTPKGSLRFSYGHADRVVPVSDRVIDLFHTDGVRERLESRDNAIEQSFVIDQWKGGDTVIDAALTSDLPSSCNELPGEGIVFSHDDAPAMVYRKAVAFDATGRSLKLSIRHDGRRVRMAIPVEWMESAVLPVVLDPIVGSAAILDTGVAVPGAGGIMHRFGAAFAASHYFVAWQSGSTIKTQRITSAGLPVGSPLTFTGKHPQVAYSPSSSSFLVVYDDGSVVWGQRFSTDGTLLGSPFTIGDVVGVWDQSPHVCWGGSRWFVVWHAFGTVYGQFVNADGTLSGTAINCSGTNQVFGAGFASGDYEPPRVAYASGTYMVVCRDPLSFVVAFRVSDATSAVVGSTVTVGGQTFARFADVAGRPNATTPEFLVLWPDAILVVTDLQTFVYSNIVTPDGTVSAPTTLASSVGTSNVLGSMVAVTYSAMVDQFIAAYGWAQDAGGDPSAVARIQRLTATGAFAAPVESTMTNIADPHDAIKAIAPGSGTGGILVGQGAFNALYTQVWAASGAASVPPTVTWPPSQLNSDGSTPLAQGGTASGTSISIQATIAEPDAGQQAKLQVEVRKVGTAFQNIMTHESALGALGANVILPIPLTGGGQYHWQIRAVDSGGAVSTWAPFGGSTADFVIPNQPPAAPTGLQQLQGTTPIPVGGWSTSSTLVLKGTMADDMSTVKLEVEIKAVGTAFTNTATNSSGFVANGATATINATVAAGTKHWQARAVDTGGLASPWISFGGNAEAAADVAVDLTAPTVVITSPGSAAILYTNLSPMTLGGTTSDANGIASVSWSNAANGTTGTATVSAASWTSPPITLTNIAGVNNVITVTATDNAGNSQTDTVTVKYDTVAPTAIVTTPATSPTTATASPVTVVGTAADLVGVTGVLWSNAANGATGTATGTTTWNFVASLAAGSNTITISPTDAAGNVGSTTVVVILSPPEIGLSPSSLAFAAPQDGPNPAAQSVSITNTGGGTLTWTASDTAAWLTTTTSGTAPSTMAVTADVTGLAAGSYNGTITVSAVGATSQTVAVSLTVNAPPAIGLNPTSLSFAAPQGGPNPAAQSVSISNTGGGTLNWTASDSAAWLTTTTSGAAPSTMTVTADVTGLAAGSYNGTITVSAVGATSQTVAVSLTVNAPPAIGLNPTSLSFAAPQGGPNPAAQSVSISNTGGGTLNWTASDSAAWLTTTTSGAAPSTMTVTADVTGLAAGSYNGTITVNAVGATPQTVAVSLTVNAGPAIGLSPTSMTFSATQGGANPAAQSVSISNTGGGTLNWTASDTAAWLTTTTSGTAPSTMTVTADVTGLTAGSYNGTITVSAVGATPQTVAVSLTVNAGPAIGLSPTSMTFSATQGGPNPAAQSVSISNTGGGTLNWTASDSAAWLTTTTSGTAPSTMTVTADVTGLTAGSYNGTITVSAVGATPQTVAVSLTVNAGPAIGLSPTSMTFSATQGGANPAAQSVSISNTGGGTLNWTASDNAAWLTTTTSGNAPSTMTVTADVTGLAAGSYNGTITVSAVGAISQTVAVSLTVIAPPAIGLNPTSLSFAAPQSGPNPIAQTVTISNAGGGTLAWGASETALWLTLTPATGTLSAGASQPISAIIDVTGLAAGAYTSTITVTAPGAAAQTVGVSLTVSALPAIVVAPTSLTFAAPQGGPNPLTQTVTVTNTGGGTLAWSATDNAAWLSLSPATGTLSAGAAQPMTAIIDVAGLAPGTYNGTITTSGSGAAPQTVAVTLTVSALPAIGVAPVSLSFSAPEGGANPPVQTFTVTNTGGGTLNWTLADNAAWMSSTPGAGALAAGASQVVAVAVDTAGLTAGTNSGQIQLTPSATVAVTLTVNGTPALALSLTGMTFSAPVGGPSPGSQNVTITNAGTGVLAWTATESAPWMTVNPPAGSLATGAAEAMTVLVDVAGLAAGTYNGAITMAAPGVATQVISVTLNVNGAPVIGLSTTTISLRASESSSASLQLAISNLGSGVTAWTMTPSAFWLNMTPPSGSLGAAMSENVTVTAGGMAAGTHTGTILVTAPGASNSGQVITVTLQVDAAGSHSKRRCGLVGLDAVLVLAALALARRLGRR